MFIFSLILLFSLNYKPVELSRWVGPGTPTPYHTWINSQSTCNFEISEVYRSSYLNDSLVNIIVSSELYPDIETNLSIYTQDLEREGYSIVVDTVTSTQTITAVEAIRVHLQSQLSQGLVGVFFIGNTPIAWYQNIDNWGYGPENYSEFPVDLYYMDLDGIWRDDSMVYNNSILIPGSDSIFDSHLGDVSPDIWMGRLYFSTLYTLGTEADLVNQYLYRVHLYHCDSMFAVSRGLCYVDDDWEVDAPQFINDMHYAYSVVRAETYPESTRVSSYRDHLRDNYEWVGIFCHSSPTLHSFTINQGTGHDYMFSSDIIGFIPQGFFYNLYACSNARYIENSNMGCMYIMGTPKGLGSIGSTKTGAMMEFYYFYHPLGMGKSMGKAFQAWFQYIAYNGFSIYEKSYHYGMTLLGDPTLTLKVPGCYLILSSLLINDSTGNSNGRLDPGETAELGIYICNHYDAQLSGNLSVNLTCNDPDLNFNLTNFNYGSIQPGDSTVNPQPCTVQVSSNASLHTSQIIFNMSDNLSGRFFTDTVFIPIGTPPILVVDDDQAGAEQHCIDCLDNLDYDFEVISPETFQLNDLYLSNYQAVIWLTGSDTANTLTAGDQTAIENYYQDSGMIVIHGQNIAEELQNSYFMQNFLHLSWLGNSANNFHYGVDGDPIGNGVQLVLGTQYSQDILSGDSAVFPCFSYQVNSDSLSVVRMENQGKLIFAGFGFEGIRSGIPGYMSEDSLYQRILDYFQVTTAITEIPVNPVTVTGIRLISTVYQPGKITFSILTPEDMNLDIKIYNILGSPVKILYQQYCLNNILDIAWDLSDHNGIPVSSGIYFLRINSRSQTVVNKLYLLD